MLSVSVYDNVINLRYRHCKLILLEVENFVCDHADISDSGMVARIIKIIQMVGFLRCKTALSETTSVS